MPADDKPKTAHPGIQRIHDLLYLDMQGDEEFYDPNKNRDADTMSMIADVVAEYIPRPQKTSNTASDVDSPCDQADSPCTRKWECPDCGKTIDHSYEALVDVGTPICGDCDVDMEMV